MDIWLHFKAFLFYCAIVFVVAVFCDGLSVVASGQSLSSWAQDYSRLLFFIPAAITGGLATTWVSTWTMEERVEEWVVNWKWPARFEKWMSGE